MTRKRLRWIKAAVVLVLVGGGVGWFALRRSAGDEPVTFRVARLDRGTIEQTVTATGQLSAVVTVQVGSQVSGIISSLGADFNSEVKAGQIIAQIDPTRIKANLEQARASMKNAQASLARAEVNHQATKREYDRGKALSDKMVIGESELDELQSRFELARVELQSAHAQVAQARAQVGMVQEDLARTTIRSPIDGVVLQRAVDVGQTVAASLSAPTIFTIAQDLSKMEVRAAVDEADVGKLKEGLEAQFTVDAHPGREFVATIFQIRSNPNVVSNVVTYDAILRVDNPDGKLLPGMTASVRIVTEKREDVLRIPNAALRFRPPPNLIAENTERPFGRMGRGDAGARDDQPGDRQPGDRQPGEGGGRRMRGEGGPMAQGEGGGRWRERMAGGGDGALAGRRGFGEGGGRGMGGGGRGAGGRNRVLARVYKAQGEKVVVIPFRPGIADDEYTEVLRGPLEAGDEIVTEASGPALDQAPDRSQQNPRGGARRGRGPRFF